MPSETVYWLFTASAQAISALFAFLLAAIALVQAMMQQSQDRDDSLVEIHQRIQKDHYARMVLLALVVGAAILLSLLLVSLNRPAQNAPILAVVAVALVNVAAIGGSIWFVVWIIKPDRYARAAREMAKQESRQLGPPARTGEAAAFFIAFVQLEKALRAIVQRKKLYLPGQAIPKLTYSFRKMIEALYQNELISREFYGELQEINRYRNVIFHGHEDQVDERMVTRTEAARDTVKALSKEMRPKKPSTGRRTTR